MATLNVKVKMAPNMKSKWLLLVSVEETILRTLSHFTHPVTKYPGPITSCPMAYSKNLVPTCNVWKLFEKSGQTE
jgi:hypothetical protein